MPQFFCGQASPKIGYKQATPQIKSPGSFSDYQKQHPGLLLFINYSRWQDTLT